jgi:hypothetical protein
MSEIEMLEALELALELWPEIENKLTPLAKTKLKNLDNMRLEKSLEKANFPKEWIR